MICSYYAKRMQIEETFRDIKNHRFGWSLRDAQSRKDKRWAVLLLIVALAILVVTVAGYWGERHGLHKQYQANTISNRRVLSYFFG